jgi:diguanylate cyclase (GGDEF)-like protein
MTPPHESTAGWGREAPGSIELKGFNRTLAEIEWLLLVLILVYMALPDEPVDYPLRVLTAGAVFAVFVVGFRYANLFTLPARWKLTIETWAMLALTAVAVWHSGKVDSPLLNLFLLVVIFSALTLGRLITLLELALITSFYLLAAYAVEGSEIFRYEIFSSLMLRFAPFVLVAYVTSLLAADLGLARAFVERLADTDELTGLSNMRAFNQAMARHERLARQRDEALSVLMVDIDNLKAINDHHGHDTGNLAIRRVANAIKSSVRSNDVVARYGGDEFIVLLPAAPEAAARRAGERILRHIAEEPVEGVNGPAGVSVSIGLATFPVMAKGMEELMHRADQALYASKRAGRNRLSTYRVLQPA